jgi:hypothetical protein
MQAQIVDSELHVAYDFRNDTSAAVVVYDGATVVGEEVPDLRRSIYVSLRGETAAIMRTRAATPSNARINRIRIPTVSVVLAGAARRIRFRLPLPLREHSEYTPDFPGASYELRAATIVQLQVGYFPMQPDTRLEPLPSAPNAFEVGGQFAEQAFVSDRVSLRVPIEMRTDAAFIRL